MQRLVDGLFDVSLPERDRADEIGAMTRAVSVFRDNAVERQRLEVNSAGEQRLRAERQHTIESLIEAFRREAGNALGDHAPGCRAHAGDIGQAHVHRPRHPE